MDFDTIAKRAAKELNLLDSSGEIITGGSLTETRIRESVNDAYLEDIYPILMTQYPQDFEQYDYVANYSVTGTGDAASTGTTLVATTSIFTESMIGQNIENNTDSEYTTITGYTSGTTVTVKATIGDDWDGDTLRVLDRDYTLGDGNYTVYAMRDVFVRYDSSSNDNYKRARQRIRGDAFQTGLENYSKDAPIYTLGSNVISSVQTRQLSIYPLFTASDSLALKLTYLTRPAAMSADGDLPAFPIGHHKFLMWYAVKEGAIHRKDNELAQLAEYQYEKGKKNLLNSYRPTSMDQNVKIRIPRRVGLMHQRRK